RGFAGHLCDLDGPRERGFRRYAMLNDAAEELIDQERILLVERQRLREGSTNSELDEFRPPLEIDTDLIRRFGIARSLRNDRDILELACSGNYEVHRLSARFHDRVPHGVGRRDGLTVDFDDRVAGMESCLRGWHAFYNLSYLYPTIPTRRPQTFLRIHTRSNAQMQLLTVAVHNDR